MDLEKPESQESEEDLSSVEIEDRNSQIFTITTENFQSLMEYIHQTELEKLLSVLQFDSTIHDMNKINHILSESIHFNTKMWAEFWNNKIIPNNCPQKYKSIWFLELVVNYNQRLKNLNLFHVR